MYVLLLFVLLSTASTSVVGLAAGASRPTPKPPPEFNRSLPGGDVRLKKVDAPSDVQPSNHQAGANSSNNQQGSSGGSSSAGESSNSSIINSFFSVLFIVIFGTMYFFLIFGVMASPFLLIAAIFSASIRRRAQRVQGDKDKTAAAIKSTVLKTN